MTDTGIEPVDKNYYQTNRLIKIITRPLEQPKDKLGQCQEKPG